MQVSGIGMTSSIAVGEKSAISSKGTNFLGLFGSLLNTSNKSQETNSLNGLFTSLSGQDLTSLLSFLKTNDCLDLNGGAKLLGKESDMNNPELLQTITSFLGLNEQDLKNILEKLKSLLSNASVATPQQIGNESDTLNSQLSPSIKDLKENKTDQANSQNRLENEPLKKETSSLGLMEELIASLNQIMTLPIQDISKFINHDFVEGTKVVKLYELLTNNQGQNATDSKLSQVITETIQKLETIVNQSKDASSTVYLQKAYQSIAEDAQATNHTVQNKKLITFKIDNGSSIIQFQQMSKPEQLTIMLDKGGKPVSAEQFIQQFENILAKSQFSNTGGTQKLFIKLNPENLGSIRIELTQKDSGLVAKIMTTTSAAKDALESQLQGLKTAFHTQNLQIDKIEVSQSMLNQQERFLQRDPNHGDRQNQDQQSKQQKDNGDSNLSFEETLLNTEI
ncbi:MAG: flagellar hook-length control protein FliK [Bacillota bacterium]|nr:flagellar hook-length control protein FliK [Bacillota bacterium]